MPQRIQIYDTTLRDGSQGEGVNFSLQDKLQIAQRLDDLGVDFIEGGYPLSNEKDTEFFQRAAKMDFKNAKICAFGMTRRKSVDAADDVGMKALIACQAPVIASPREIRISFTVTFEELLKRVSRKNTCIKCNPAGKPVETAAMGMPLPERAARAGSIIS